MSAMSDPFGARTPLAGHGLDYYRLGRLDEAGVADTSRLPYTVRVLLEMALRNAGSIHVTEDDVRALANWPAPAPDTASVAFLPARVILQDFTGVPAVVDLAAMRSAMARAGRAPSGVDPLVPADLVIDHSVQVDAFGTRFAYARNIEREYERNGERYALLRWAQGAFDGFRVVPPGMGIVHQVNLEHLGPRGAGARRRGAARHARRHRLAHDHDRRARHPRLGRRRHRGRGRDAGRAAGAADPDRDRRRVPRRAAHRRHRHRSRADADRDAAQARRSRQVRRVLRRRPVGAVDPGPRDAVEHGAGVRRHRVHLPGRRGDAALPGADRPRRRRARWSRRTRGRRACGAPTATRRPSSPSCSCSTSTPSCRAWPARAGRRTACRSARAGELPRRLPARSLAGAAGRRGAGAGRRRGVHRGARGRRRDRPRRGRDRRHHVLHEHVEPVRDDRRRPAGAERGRARPGDEAVGEDEPRARLPRRHRLPRARRPHGVARRTPASTSSATAARPASATPGRSPTRSPQRSRSTTWRSSRCCPATATSRAASTRRCAPATSPRRRWWWPTRWPAASRSTSTRSRSAPAPTASRCILRDIWPTPEEVRDVIAASIDAEHVRDASTRGSGTATSGGARWRRRPASEFAWDDGSTYVREPPYFAGPAARAGAARGRRRRARAGDARRLGHDRPHLPRRIDPARPRRPAGT